MTYTSRDVEFHEEKFTAGTMLKQHDWSDETAEIEPPQLQPMLDAFQQQQASEPLPESGGSLSSVHADSQQAELPESSSESEQSQEWESESEAPAASQSPPTTMLRSGRVSHRPREYWRADECAHAAMITPPTTYHQAVGAPEGVHWKKAIDEEYASIMKHDTWDLVELPPDRRPVTCKWVFNVKQKADGSIDRYEARLVARGFTQAEGINYHETFSPVVKMTSIRVLLAITAIRDLELHQMDVKTAFLNDSTEEEICMTQPEELRTAG